MMMMNQLKQCDWTNINTNLFIFFVTIAYILTSNQVYFIVLSIDQYVIKNQE